MHDLFGEIPVTWPEIWAWVEEATGMKPDNWRAKYYIQHWDIPGKIRAEKLRSTGLTRKTTAPHV